MIFPDFLKSEGNLATACRAYALVSSAIDRVLWKPRKIQAFLIRHISHAKVSYR